MEKRQLKDRFPFDILSIKTNSFSVNDIEEEELSEIDLSQFKFSIIPEFTFDKKEDNIRINLLISYENKNKEILKIDVDTIFKCYISEDVENKDIDLLSNLFGIAYSTVRGIVLNRTLGNSLNSIYLPIINSREIVQAEVKKKKE